MGSEMCIRDRLNSEVVEIKPDQSLLTKRYTDFAIDFINDQKKGKPFFLYLAHTMPHIPIFASDKFRGKSKGSLYGDVIQEIDYNVGRLVKTLKDRKEFDNTIIIYTSDNGPWLTFGNHGGSSGVLRGGKFDVFDAGREQPCMHKRTLYSACTTACDAHVLIRAHVTRKRG